MKGIHGFAPLAHHTVFPAWVTLLILALRGVRLTRGGTG